MSLDVFWTVQKMHACSWLSFVSCILSMNISISFDRKMKSEINSSMIRWRCIVFRFMTFQLYFNKCLQYGDRTLRLLQYELARHQILGLFVPTTANKTCCKSLKQNPCRNVGKLLGNFSNFVEHEGSYFVHKTPPLDHTWASLIETTFTALR